MCDDAELNELEEDVKPKEVLRELEVKTNGKEKKSAKKAK